MKKIILLLLGIVIAYTAICQVNINAKSLRLINADSTQGTQNGTIYYGTNGFRFRQNGAWVGFGSLLSPTASNGLTKVGNDIKLGGALTQNTTIQGGSYYNILLGSNPIPLGQFSTYVSSAIAPNEKMSITVLPGNMNFSTTNGVTTSSVEFVGSGDLNLGITGFELNTFGVKSLGNHNFTTSNGNINFTATLGSSTFTAGSTIAINSGGTTTISPTGAFVVSTNSTAGITGNAGASIVSSSGAVTFNTNSLSRLAINNNGSWAVNSATGTSGQVLTSAGAAGSPTWTTPSKGWNLSGRTKLTGSVYVYPLNSADEIFIGSNFNQDSLASSVRMLSNTLTQVGGATSFITTDGSGVDAVTNGLDPIQIRSGGSTVIQTATVERLEIENDGAWQVNGSTGTSGQVLTSAGASASPTWQAATVTSPAGSTTQIQYNNAGAFGAEAGFTYDAGTNTFVTPSATISNLTSTRIPITGVSGLLGDNTNLTFLEGGASDELRMSDTGGLFRAGPVAGTSATYAPTSLIFNSAGGNSEISSANGDMLTTADNLTYTVGIGGAIVINGQSGHITMSTANGGDIVFTTPANADIRLTPTGSTGFVIIQNLPTSCSGAPTGAIWNDAGTLKICP